ncbi:hypothetical protein NDU88_003664 [Pleurodeles waltl]|uniref:Secreted protein n=1 Tax=Pleurodeles waltl TaxID=8319 RepID=A0AAV7TRS2_PLEWA|nr:hypothetical protein NDU88_003664 [Pleurodeles waltl]
MPALTGLSRSSSRKCLLPAGANVLWCMLSPSCRLRCLTCERLQSLALFIARVPTVLDASILLRMLNSSCSQYSAVHARFLAQAPKVFVMNYIATKNSHATLLRR